MKVAAIVLCGGSGSRFGKDKLIEDLGGRSVWAWAVATMKSVCDFVVVVDSGRGLDFGVDTVVAGGANRQASVRNGLSAIPLEYDYVLIHDAARPFVTQELIRKTVEAARQTGAATAAVRMTDTVRQDDGYTLDRDQLWSIQTPQCGRREDLIRAHQINTEATDDAGLLQQAGVSVCFVEGDRRNIKITTRDDLEMARAMVGGNAVTRTGFGYDIHTFSQDPGRTMMLGGVQFEGPGLAGHSDADVLLHAAVDALLGAAGLGDIGVHYPPGDPQWKNCPSLRFLKETGLLLRAEGWEIENLDATLIAETPKIMPRSKEIRETIASTLGIATAQVNVKATTNEGLGALGREEGIAAMAIATLRRALGDTDK